MRAILGFTLIVLISANTIAQIPYGQISNGEKWKCTYDQNIPFLPFEWHADTTHFIMLRTQWRNACFTTYLDTLNGRVKHDLTFNNGIHFYYLWDTVKTYRESWIYDSKKNLKFDHISEHDGIVELVVNNFQGNVKTYFYPSGKLREIELKSNDAYLGINFLENGISSGFSFCDYNQSNLCYSVGFRINHYQDDYFIGQLYFVTLEHLFIPLTSIKQKFNISKLKHEFDIESGIPNALYMSEVTYFKEGNNPKVRSKNVEDYFEK